jgi:hypothetical protein
LWVKDFGVVGQGLQGSGFMVKDFRVQGQGLQGSGSRTSGFRVKDFRVQCCKTDVVYVEGEQVRGFSVLR